MIGPSVFWAVAACIACFATGLVVGLRLAFWLLAFLARPGA